MLLNREEMKKIILIAAICSAMAGCATTSPIVPYGRDSYLINAEDVWGGNSSGSLQVKAAQEANKFCASQGKVMRVRNTSGEGTAGWTTTSANLVFSCIAESDTENTRPDLRPAASTVVEIRK